MEVVHLTPYYAPAWAYGGVPRAVEGLARAQAARGHTVHVLTTDSLSPRERSACLEELLDGVHVVRVRNLSNVLRGRLNLSTPSGLRSTLGRILDSGSVEIIHAHEFRTVENLELVRMSHCLPALVLSPHGTLPHETGRSCLKRMWDLWLGRSLFGLFDHVVALTERESTDVRRLWRDCGNPLEEERISVIPNGVRLEDFSALPSGEEFRSRWGLGDGPVVLYLGRLSRRKNLAELVSAFGMIAAELRGARLVLAGPGEPGEKERLRGLAQRLGIGPRVLFTGCLTGVERLGVLAAADLFVMPAVGEGFSVAILEAMACGVAVVASEGCYFNDIQSSGAGVVIETDPHELARALLSLLLNDSLRVEMGRRGRGLAGEQYAWEQLAPRVEEVYAKTLRWRERSAKTCRQGPVR